MIEVIKAFKPTQKHIRAGQVFTYLLSSGEEYYGLVVKHNWTLGPFQKCLLLYLFDATTEIDCNDPPLSAQVMLLKHTLERVFSCRAPDAGVGNCRTGSSRPAHAWHAAGSQSGDGVRIAL